jgi:hypothetical protein
MKCGDHWMLRQPTSQLSIVSWFQWALTEVLIPNDTLDSRPSYRRARASLRTCR